jgi:hypothetical protein
MYIGSLDIKSSNFGLDVGWNVRDAVEENNGYITIQGHTERFLGIQMIAATNDQIVQKDVGNTIARGILGGVLLGPLGAIGGLLIGRNKTVGGQKFYFQVNLGNGKNFIFTNKDPVTPFHSLIVKTDADPPANDHSRTAKDSVAEFVNEIALRELNKCSLPSEFVDKLVFLGTKLIVSGSPESLTKFAWLYITGTYATDLRELTTFPGHRDLVRKLSAQSEICFIAPDAKECARIMTWAIEKASIDRSKIEASAAASLADIEMRAKASNDPSEIARITEEYKALLTSLLNQNVLVDPKAMIKKKFELDKYPTEYMLNKYREKMRQELWFEMKSIAKSNSSVERFLTYYEAKQDRAAKLRAKERINLTPEELAKINPIKRLHDEIGDEITNLTISEIAERTGKTTRAVEAHLSRASMQWGVSRV